MIRARVGGSFFRQFIVALAILITATSAITTTVLTLAPAPNASAACSTGSQGDCTAEEDCINVGNGDWVYKPVGTTARWVCQAQSSDPSQQCSASNLDKCSGQKGVACVQRANGVWQFQGGTTGQYKCVAGSTDPAKQCSPANLANCNSEPACTAQGQGKWQQKSGTTGTYECVAGSGGTGSTDAPADTDAIGDCGGGGLNWVVCPVIQLAKKGAIAIDSFIMNSLEVDVTGIFETTCTSDNKAVSDPEKTCTGKYYYAAWNSFRIIATAVLVVAGLVMVISQALGFDFLDAYTIRKVLPRLIIAIIGMSLSWPLMKFAVDFFNVLGNDIRSLIYAPFSNLGGNIDLSVGIGSSLGILAGGLVLGAIGLLSFMATALLAVFVGFVIIVVRQIAIVMLVVVAPIAIACYILPNTEKVWKLWKDNFMGLLLMFPIISGLIAAGHVFSAVALTDNSGGTATGANLVGQIVGIVAYFLPYFLLPLTFRLATGVIGTIAGFANDRGRGVFDRLKKGRQTRMADRISRAQNEKLWDPNSKLGKFGNKVATWSTDPLGNAAFRARNAGIPGLSKRGQKIASHIEHASTEQSGKLFEELNKMGYNDKAFRALSGVHRDLDKKTQDRLEARGLLNKSPTSLSQLQEVADILGQGSDSEKLASNAIHGSMGRLATLYQDQEMGKANIAAAGIMGLAAHGFASTGDLAQAGNSLQKQVGSAGAQSIISQAQLMGSRSRPDTKPGYGVMYDSKNHRFVDGLTGSVDAEGNPILGEDGKQLVGSRARQVVKSLNSHDLASAKGGAFDALEGTLDGMIKDGGNEARAVEDQLFSWAGPYSQASVDVKDKTLKFMQTRSARGMRTKIRRDEDGKAVRDAAGNAVTYQEEGWAEGSLMDKFESYSRRETNPETRGEGGGPPDDGGGGAGGGPGGH